MERCLKENYLILMVASLLHWLIMVARWLPCGTRISTKMIWCAEIMLKRPKTGEVWGEVEWCDICLFDEWLERSYTCCHLLMNLHMKKHNDNIYLGFHFK